MVEQKTSKAPDNKYKKIYIHLSNVKVNRKTIKFEEKNRHLCTEKTFFTVQIFPIHVFLEICINSNK